MRGGIEIDAVVAIGVFLVFLSWAFLFYGTLIEEEGNPLAKTAETTDEIIMNFLQVDVISIPVIFVSENQTIDKVLFMDFVWSPGTKNTTKVFSGGNQLPCQFSGSTLYWQADVTNSSPNYFTVRYSTQNVSLGCDDSFAIENESQTYPFAGEKVIMISQERMNNMTNTSYETFRSNLGIPQEFRVEMNMSGAITIYGPSLPVASDVIAHTISSVVEETSEDIELTLLIF